MILLSSWMSHLHFSSKMGVKWLLKWRWLSFGPIANWCVVCVMRCEMALTSWVITYLALEVDLLNEFVCVMRCKIALTSWVFVCVWCDLKWHSHHEFLCVMQFSMLFPSLWGGDVITLAFSSGRFGYPGDAWQLVSTVAARQRGRAGLGFVGARLQRASQRPPSYNRECNDASANARLRRQVRRGGRKRQAATATATAATTVAATNAGLLCILYSIYDAQEWAMCSIKKTSRL